eukprot:g6854.t1
MPDHSLAIIGGGATGLIALRSALWSRKNIETPRRISPVYKDLRANLPMAVMGIPGYVDHSTSSSFPSHAAVLEYLERFEASLSEDIERFNAMESPDLAEPANKKCDVRYHTTVTGVEPLWAAQDESEDPHAEDAAGTKGRSLVSSIGSPNKRRKFSSSSAAAPTGYKVTSQDAAGHASAQSSTFDAVLVCNGKFAIPHVPAEFAGEAARSSKTSQPLTGEYQSQQEKILWRHSFFFDRAEDYSDHDVVVVGAGASGRDLVDMLRPHARRVFWEDVELISCWEQEDHDSQLLSAGASQEDQDLVAETLRLPEQNSCSASGTSVPSSAHRTTILLATGYHFEYPFLPESLQPGAEPSVPCSSKLRDGMFLFHNLAFLCLPNRMVPFLVAYHQALAFLYQRPKMVEGVERATPVQLDLDFNFDKLGLQTFAYLRHLLQNRTDVAGIAEQELLALEEEEEKLLCTTALENGAGDSAVEKNALMRDRYRTFERDMAVREKMYEIVSGLRDTTMDYRKHEFTRYRDGRYQVVDAGSR